MTWDEALDTLADHPHAWRFAELCDEANPDREQRDGYRREVVRIATGEPPAAPAPVRVDYGTQSGPSSCCGQSPLEAS